MNHLGFIHECEIGVIFEKSINGIHRLKKKTRMIISVYAEKELNKIEPSFTIKMMMMKKTMRFSTINLPVQSEDWDCLYL